jgi:hypothetical protein
MEKTKKKENRRHAKNRNKMTLIEQKRSIRNAVLKGVELGLDYKTIANSCGICKATLGHWFKCCRETEKKFESLRLSEEEITELSTLNGDLIKRRKELEDRYGVGVITVVEEDKFWLKLVYDLKKADSRAETRMLGVIRGAAIGHHEVTEKKVIEDSIKRTVQTTTTTKQLPPI